MRPLGLVYDLQKRLWRLFRPRTRGVKVMLFNGKGELLLIRNTYGRSDLFLLPGGGVRPFEEPYKAAVREVREELGCEAVDLVFVSTHSNVAEGKRDTIHLFRALVRGDPSADGVEVRQAAFFAPDALPEATSPATRRRIEEYKGLRQSDGTW